MYVTYTYINGLYEKHRNSTVTKCLKKIQLLPFQQSVSFGGQLKF